MKRYIKASTTVPKLRIIVDITYSEVQVQVAASSDFKELKHPSIKRKFKKSDEWLKQVNDLVRSIIGSMNGKKFKIIKACPSNKSYTYYIRFQPSDKNGDLWDQELELQIELRDHASKTHASVGEITNRFLVKTYYLEDKTYKDMLALMREIWRILDDLQNGDFSSFVS